MNKRMPIARWSQLLLISGSLLAAPAAMADDFDELDQRLRALEQQMPETQSGGMPGLVSDIQAMQQEIRELRGEIERLQYEAQQQRIRQRDMNLDLEKRLSALEKQGQTASPPAARTPAQKPPTPPVIAPAAGDDASPAPEDVDNAAQTDEAQPDGDAPSQADNQQDNAQAEPDLNEQDEYLKAFELLKQGSYDESITAFDGFLKNFPDGTYADNARYWLAETHYVKKDYPIALEHFEQLITQYPNSSKLPGALLKIGYIQYEMGNNAEARLSLERVRKEFSGTNVADLAKQRLDRMDREGR